MKLAKGINLNGNFSVYYENYAVSGREGRRPPNTLRVHFTPVLSFWGLSLGLKMDFFLTTEQKFVAQPINRLSLRPEWSWGKVYFGSFSAEFSDFTYSGMTVRGGGIDLHPSGYKLFLIGGTVRKENEDSLNESFRRILYGVQVGAGKEVAIHLNIVKVRDDPSSLPQPKTITPEENLVSSIELSMRFFNRLRLGGEAAASIYTMDLNSPELDTSKIPDFVRSFIKLTHSTRLDYAWRVRGSIDIWKATLGFSYKYVGPGYTSLGLVTSHNDMRAYRARIKISPISSFSMALSHSEQRDNLIGNKTSTTTKRATRMRMRFTPVNYLTVSVFVTSGNTLEKPEEEADTLEKRTEENVLSFRILPVVSFNLWRKQSTNVEYSADLVESRDGDKQGTHRISLMHSVFLSEISTVGLSVAYLTSNGYDDGRSFLSYTLTASYRAFGKRLPLNFSLFFLPSKETRKFRTILRARYILKKTSSIKFTWKFTNYTGESEKFWENTLNLFYTVRF